MNSSRSELYSAPIPHFLHQTKNDWPLALSILSDSLFAFPSIPSYTSPSLSRYPCLFCFVHDDSTTEVPRGSAPRDRGNFERCEEIDAERVARAHLVITDHVGERGERRMVAQNAGRGRKRWKGETGRERERERGKFQISAPLKSPKGELQRRHFHV